MIEGRLIWFLMGKVAFHERQDLEENILSQQRHRLKMLDNDLATDVLVRMARNFVVEEGDEFSNFQDLHRESCLLLQIHKPHYRKRKLKSNALVLTMFMMIEREVEENKDKTAKKLFVEVFGDREAFLEAFLKELEKTDDMEKEMGRQPMRLDRVMSNALEEDFDPEHLNLTNNESLLNLLNFFQNKELHVLSR